jgi:lysophospholipase L1-like esterase
MLFTNISGRTEEFQIPGYPKEWPNGETRTVPEDMRDRFLRMTDVFRQATPATVVSDGVSGKMGFLSSTGVAYQQIGAGPTSNILIGDSKTAQNFTTTVATGYSPKWAVLGNAALGWPFALINGGVSGNTTAQMLARLPALLAANPGDGWLTIRGMVNDIQSGDLVASNPTGAQITKEQIAANILGMAKLGIQAGKKIAICTDTGPTTGFATLINAQTEYAALMRSAFAYVNRYIRSICNTYGFVLIDIETAVMDPATGLPVSGYIRADGVHVTYTGSGAEAQAFVAGFVGHVPTQRRSASARLDPGNLAGPTAGAAGSVTADAANDTRIIAPATAAGGIPSGWSISQFRTGGGAAGSKVARVDYTPGTAAQLAFTSTASFGGAGFSVGGDVTNALGRWDQGYATSAAYAVGRRVNANGKSYVCVTAGNTSAADPTAGWSTTDGAIVADAGGAVFICRLAL